jgi:predicted ATPase
MNVSNKYIISGGPGAGKTSLLQALLAHGYNCSEEASRRLIVEQVAMGTHCLPWIDLACFADKVLMRMIQLYQQSALNQDITFFDRGIPDIIAYLKIAGLPIKEHYYAALQQYPYHPTVFILPPWKEIYVNDAERWQTFEEAVVLHTAIKETYQAFGYTLIEIPKGTVAERLRFLLKIAESSNNKIPDLHI